MAIQFIFWDCDRCVKTEVVVVEVGPYDDPVVVPPNGWDYAKDENTFCCPECLERERIDL